MDYEVVVRPEMTVVGIECRTSNDPEAGPNDIPRLWEKFAAQEVYNRIPNKASGEVVALYCDYEGDYTEPYSVVIGCKVKSAEEIPEGMVAKTLPETPYAVFRAVGEHPQTLIETWSNIWQMGELERTYTGDYETYDEVFMTAAPEDKEIEVSIAISN